MHFDDRCYGYAVISYGDKPKCYDSTYRNWLKDIMQSMEAFYRQAALKSLLAKIEITQVRDALTGLYNFKGFLNKGLELKDKNTYEDGRMLIMVIDLIGLKDINSLHGRNMGDDALLSLTHIITNTIGHNQVCGRLSNSEFGAAIFTDDATEKAKQISELIEEAVEKFNQETEQPYKLTICIGSRSDVISGAATLEYLINEAIKDKNDKRLIRQNSLKHRDGMDIESIENDRIVTDILDHNRLKYFFQPIVSAKTGEIYSYEALMRADTDAELTPPEILESAERMERLYDVEKATFFNVLDYVEAHKNELYGRKVFINSIPGYQLKGEDKKLLEGRMLKHQGELVVEFTEETEIGDKQLVEIKDNYANLNIETAIDDYGSGYSNVNNLLRYMPKYVKIDRALMTDIHKNPQKQHFVKDIIEFAHANDILTLAEGVELSEELKEVIRLGVDLIQGYYTAKPQPYFMAKIDERVITEIVQYNQVAMSRYTKRYYEADGEARISMVKLALNKYTGLILRRPARGENKVELGGIPGFQSNLIIRVADGFEGEVVLNNISLSGDRGIPCIDIGNDCKLKLTLVGDNELLTGGIRVPETSSLTFYGEGNLSILINSGKYYAIGNDLDSRNGEIIFDQDGGIIIDANGMRGVGIGSGLGGDISIHRGHYEMEMKGQEGVCIGSVYGDTNLSIEYCDMDIYSGISNGTVLGSYTGDAEVFMENISARITGSGNTIVGIGTYAGDRCKASIRNASATFNIRATECYAMGSNSADTEVDIAYASVKVAVQGKQAYAFGNDRRDARVLFANSDVRTDVRNNSDIDIAADEANIRIENGGGEFIINGRNIEREAILTTL
jgi:diguanylate cyclase (GGDEF)-like protein